MDQVFAKFKIGNRAFEIQQKELSDVYEIRPEVQIDSRGGLIRTNTIKLLHKYGLDKAWVEDYYSFTAPQHTVRGLYVQRAPYSVNKLITAVRGELLWVCVDLRKGSKTFGAWTSCMLSGNIYNSFFVPRGCANGCISISAEAGVYIKQDNYYNEEHGLGIIWNDQDIGIDWRSGKNEIVISETHSRFGNFKDFVKSYKYIDRN
jgi:dTDP-4-dehydrorhamnose 3,5-epimerase